MHFSFVGLRGAVVFGAFADDITFEVVIFNWLSRVFQVVFPLFPNSGVTVDIGVGNIGFEVDVFTLSLGDIPVVFTTAFNVFPLVISILDIVVFSSELSATVVGIVNPVFLSGDSVVPFSFNFGTLSIDVTVLDIVVNSAILPDVVFDFPPLTSGSAVVDGVVSTKDSISKKSKNMF